MRNKDNSGERDRILIIDDDESTRITLSKILENEGYEVETAGSGFEAIEKAKQKYFNLAFLDIKLPDTDGMELMVSLKQLNPKTEVMLITAFASLDASVQAMNEGAAGYVVKPLNMDSVLAVIGKILEKQHLGMEKRQLEERYRSLFEESIDTVFMATRQGTFTDINPAGVELFGYSSKDELLEVDIPSTLYSDPQDRDRYLNELEKSGYVKDYELILNKKDGSKITVLESTNAVYDQNGNVSGYRGIMRDITQQKQLQEEFLQSQKMESIGKLAGGTAHDFNNFLTTIMGYTELVLNELTPEDELTGHMQQIRKAGDRAKALVGQLLAFSRKAAYTPETIKLNQLLEGFHTLVGRTLGEDIKIKLLLGDDVGYIEADRTQIEQIIMNLAVNARDAMPDGGDLIVETQNVDLTGDYDDKHSAIKPGRYVQLSISDMGCGMDEDTLSQIFEPFFTTKERDAGTGLGLSTVYGIVKQHNGHITACSEEGVGTTIKVYFPRVDESSGEEAARLTMAQLSQGNEAVLLVEDEAAVRDTARAILAECGYSVTVAGNAGEALTHWHENTGKFDLLLTDVIMPGTSGRKLAETLQISNPDLRVLYMSGYTKDVFDKYDMMDEGVSILEKPFTPSELAERVREILDSS